MVRSPALAGLVISLCAPLPFGVLAAGGTPAEVQAGQPDLSRELSEAQRLIEQKDWRGALVELKAALRKDRRNPDVHNLMGYSYRKSGQLEEAFDSYRTALRLDPKHRGAHEYIGEAYLLSHQPDKARQHLAQLKDICGERCVQYQDLAKAVASYQVPAAPAK
jgi:Tfp pilus assembly protein PilF